MKKLVVFFLITIFLYGCSNSDSASLVKSKCMSCHNLVPICSKIGMRNIKGWQDSIDAMNKAGAKVSASDKEKLAKYLANLKQETAEFCK